MGANASARGGEFAFLHVFSFVFALGELHKDTMSVHVFCVRAFVFALLACV